LGEADQVGAGKRFQDSESGSVESVEFPEPESDESGSDEFSLVRISRRGPRSAGAGSRLPIAYCLAASPSEVASVCARYSSIAA
jgi:hypothetical protein